MSNANATEQLPVFSIEKLYLKDLSLEIPNAPQCFLEREPATIDVQLQTAGNSIGEDAFDVVLTVTVTARVGEKTCFLVEAAQAGIFIIRGVPPEEMDPVLAVACPNILFPYARETISDCVTRAGFPPVILAPVNFEALYSQGQQGSIPAPSTPEGEPTLQ
ncbi:MAG: protein-export chaperone SecB [Rhodocyclaceae bacterium]|nr:protein-export chaperone SecB [Rhodocyclaceae bacterium]